MGNFIAIMAALFYFLAIALIVPSLVKQTPMRTKAIFSIVSLGILCQGWLQTALIFSQHGQNFSILNVASSISLIVAIMMSFTILKTRLWFLLPIVYGFAAINIVAANFLPNSFITHLEHNPKLLLHISLALFSYSTLTIGALYALQLAWLDHQLKNKKGLNINLYLPPLMMVERQLFKIILTGHLLLTGTLLTGLTFIHNIQPQDQTHRAAFSFMAWIVYSILLWGHYRQGWRGKRVTWFAITGAIILTLAYFGDRFVTEIILK